MKKSYLEELIRVITYKVLNEIQSSQFSANPKTSKDKFKLTDDDVRDKILPKISWIIRKKVGSQAK